VEEITKWMAVNSEGIYSTRPWKIAGSAAPPAAGNTAFNERNRKDLTAADVRYTVKNGTLYAFVMGWPEREAVIPTLALGGTNQVGKIRGVTLLGHRGNLKFTQDEQSLRVTLPPEKPCEHSVCFKIVGA
jgi:alpha-L-fucosidase